MQSADFGEPFISNLSGQNGTIQFSIYGDSTNMYQVQSSTNIATGTWTDFRTVRPDEEFMDMISPNGLKRFYRLRQGP